jgi:hypothetical protein
VEVVTRRTGEAVEMAVGEACTWLLKRVGMERSGLG